VADGKQALMGESLMVADDSMVYLTVTSQHTPDATISVYRNGEQINTGQDYIRSGDSLESNITFQASGEPEWVRAEVVSSTGKVLLMSNPVYINFRD
jgi:hypothetical protein